MKEFSYILNLGLGFPEKNNFFLNFPFGSSGINNEEQKVEEEDSPDTAINNGSEFNVNQDDSDETAGFINIFKGFYLMDANKLDKDYYTKRQQEREDQQPICENTDLSLTSADAETIVKQKNAELPWYEFDKSKAFKCDNEDALKCTGNLDQC